MLFGPLPIYLVNRLRDKLAEQGASCEIFTSDEALDKFHARRKARNSPYPSFEPQEDLLFIEIGVEHMLIVKGELERMGVALKQSDFDPQFHSGEYLCPRCDYLSTSPALCPIHQMPLLEFSAWAKARSGYKEKTLYLTLAVVAVIIVAAFVWLFTRQH